MTNICQGIVWNRILFTYNVILLNCIHSNNEFQDDLYDGGGWLWWLRCWFHNKTLLHQHKTIIMWQKLKKDDDGENVVTMKNVVCSLHLFRTFVKMSLAWDKWGGTDSVVVAIIISIVILLGLPLDVCKVSEVVENVVSSSIIAAMLGWSAVAETFTCVMFNHFHVNWWW